MAKKEKQGAAGGPGQVGQSPAAPAKPKPKSWSGTWIDGERTKRDPDGGTVTVATVKTNLTDEVDRMFGLAREFASVTIETSDGTQRANAEIEAYALKAGKKPGSFVATVTVKGSRVFSQMVGRNVVVQGRQKSLPTGEEQGEPK